MPQQPQIILHDRTGAVVKEGPLPDGETMPEVVMYDGIAYIRVNAATSHAGIYAERRLLHWTAEESIGACCLPPGERFYGGRSGAK